MSDGHKTLKTKVDEVIEYFIHKRFEHPPLTIKYASEDEISILQIPIGYKVFVKLAHPIKIRGNYVTRVIMNFLKNVKSKNTILDETTLIVFAPLPKPINKLS